MVTLNYTSGTFGTATLKSNNSDEILTASPVSSHWNYCWKTYMYSFIILCLALVFYSVSTAIKYRKRLWTKKVVLALISFISTLGTMKILLLANYRQNYEDNLSEVLIGIFEKMSYPLIAGGYCLLQTIIVKTTRLDIKPIQLNGRKFVTFTSLFSMLSILSFGIIGIVFPNSSKILLVSEGMFILLSIYLCVSFIYGAPKLSKYANEVMKANKDLSVQSLSKKLEVLNDNVSSSTPSRLRNPRIRRNTTSGNRISLISCSDSSESDTTMEKYSIHKRKTSNSNKTKISKLSINDFPHLLKYINKQHSSSSDDAGIDSSKRASNSTNATLFDQPSGSDAEDESEQAFRERDFPSSNNNENSKRSQSMSDSAGKDDDTGGEIILSPSFLPSNDSNIFESGYVADSEQVSNHSDERVTSSRRSCPSIQGIRKPSSSSFEMGLPSSSSFLSLYRLRQGWMLHHVIRLVYLVTLLITVQICLKLYYMFSAYGGYFFTSKPDPWSWLIFQICQRCVIYNIKDPT